MREYDERCDSTPQTPQAPQKKIKNRSILIHLSHVFSVPAVVILFVPILQVSI